MQKQSTEKELRKMGRKELLEILYEMRVRITELEDELKEANQKLEDRTIQMKKAGSIAEAALQLNGIFEAAQQAADEYLMSVRAQAGDVSSEEMLESSDTETSSAEESE